MTAGKTGEMKTPEHRLAEEALRKSEELHLAILKTALDGFWLVDMQGRLLEVNETYCRMSGYEERELLELRISELEVIEKEDETTAHIQKTMMRGEDRFESKHRRKDGSIFDVEISAQYRPAESKIVAFVRDITERKLAEHRQFLSYEILDLLNSPLALPDMIKSILSEIRLATGFDAVGIRLKKGDDFPYFVQDGFQDDFLLSENTLIARDKDGGICKDNDDGISLECACGLVISGKTDPGNPHCTPGGSYWTNNSFPLLDLPAGQDPRINPRNKCVHAGYGSFALVPIRANQKIVGLLQLNNRKKDSLTPDMIQFFEGISPSIGVALIHKQVEEEKAKLEMQLRESQKMEAMGQLAGGISHDFNNLLSVINGYSQMLLTEPDLDAAVRPSIEEILRAGERASSLTRQLLVFSRRQSAESKIVDLDSIISGMEKMLQRLIREDIVLTRNTCKDLHRIKADPGNIEQVVMNLVINAGDAMQDGGELTIETGNVEIDVANLHHHPSDIKPGSYVMLSVSDTGCGMDEKVKERIFEPFFTTKEVGKGTGLGLATVYGIIKQSNGRIDVQSKRGKGTKFRIYFPQHLCENIADEEQKESVIPHGDETILLAEDEGGTRVMLQGFLQSIGYTVLPACNGKEALELVKKHKGKIHLLLTDIVMPEMNGFELAKQIKSSLPEVKLLFISGYNNPTDTQKRMKIDNNFLEKPLSIHTLAVKLRDMLEKR
jgi:PAS domain S-box-containing protein